MNLPELRNETKDHEKEVDGIISLSFACALSSDIETVRLYVHPLLGHKPPNRS